MPLTFLLSEFRVQRTLRVRAIKCRAVRWKATGAFFCKNTTSNLTKKRAKACRPAAGCWRSRRSEHPPSSPPCRRSRGWRCVSNTQPTRIRVYSYVLVCYTSGEMVCECSGSACGVRCADTVLPGCAIPGLRMSFCMGINMFRPPPWTASATATHVQQAEASKSRKKVSKVCAPARCSIECHHDTAPIHGREADAGPIPPALTTWQLLSSEAAPGRLFQAQTHDC